MNSTTVTCIQVTRSGNTIHTRQNQVNISNPRQLTAGTSFIAGNQRKLGATSEYPATHLHVIE